PRWAGAISSTTPRPRPRPPSYGPYRPHTTAPPLMADPRPLLEPLLALHNRIRDSVLEACEQATADQLSAVAAEEVGDTIYQIDRVGEGVLIAGMESIARHEPLLLIAEGLPQEGVALPQ